jgi:holliday junction DNA helicase RuvA
MIATLKGIIEEKRLTKVVIDAGGVGYGVVINTQDYGNLIAGKEAKLYIYEQIREDAHELFGFVNYGSQLMFEQLLGAKGVGPKAAMNILNIGTIERIKQAISSGDVKYIQSAQGVGKKAAEQVIIELKNKVGLASDELSIADIFVSNTGLEDDAVVALVSLGFGESEAKLLLTKIDQSLTTTEQRVGAALRHKGDK